MDPDDVIDLDALAEKISSAVSAELSKNLHGIESNIQTKLNENFQKLQEPVQQAVTAQFAIGIGVGSVLLSFLLYVAWQYYHKREIVTVFKDIKDRQNKLELVINSQRENATSLSSIPEQSPRPRGHSMV